MRALLLFALLALTQAAQLYKPEQQLPHPIELPAHVQTLITNHINQVLEQTPHGQVATITGHVPQPGAANKGNGQGHGHGVAVPHLDLLPPHVEQPQSEPPKVPQVINHRATATLQHAAGYNKVVMPPVAEIVVSVPGHAPLDIGDKVNKIQQRVGYIMQQAQTHIPQAINQAIKEREKLQAQKHKQGSSTTASTTTTNKPAHRAGRLLSSVEEVPNLLDHQLELKKLGKCNYQCPEKSLPVCASNGNCVVEFPGLCELNEWNCFNTKNVFSQVHDDECDNTIKCYDRDNA